MTNSIVFLQTTDPGFDWLWPTFKDTVHQVDDIGQVKDSVSVGISSALGNRLGSTFKDMVYHINDISQVNSPNPIGIPGSGGAIKTCAKPESDSHFVIVGLGLSDDRLGGAGSYLIVGGS